MGCALAFVAIAVFCASQAFFAAADRHFVLFAGLIVVGVLSMLSAIIQLALWWLA